LNRQQTAKNCYIGRFAPSPTGPLHLGSLYAALASYLDAKYHQGRWLLRIDDIDTPRNISGAADAILRDLETFGLHWDGPVSYQSQTLPYYETGIQSLLVQKQLYRCNCSRKSLLAANLANPQIYPGFCRDKRINCDGPHALRIKTDKRWILFEDKLQGIIKQQPASDPGDFVIRRKDNIVAYQFAVVIDDHLNKVNHVVRGYDLLESTPRQIFIHHILGYPIPEYMHIPVITDNDGNKLSKQTHAQAVDTDNPTLTLFLLLQLLKQNPPDILRYTSVTEILNWAITHWNPMCLQKIRAIH
jgi:glutamyl-Q tRNA(Asp) synthetase